MQRNIIHVTNVHDQKNYRVFDREIRTLAEGGHAVKYIGPAFKDEVRDGVRFLGVKKHHSEWKRALFTGASIFKIILGFPKNSIIHFHSPEWIPFALLCKCIGRTVVYDVHEDVPRQIYTKFWIPGILKPIVSKVVSGFEWLMFLTADKIIACEPVTYNRFKHDKTILLRNFPLLEEFGSASSRQRYGNKVVYVGQIFKERGILEVIKALEIVDKDLNVELILGGKFVPKTLLQECKKLKGWEKVDFRGYMSRDEVVEVLSTSKAGLLVLHPIRKYKESYPVKLFEYMAAGLPIIMSDFTYWKNIVKPYDVFWTVDPLNISSIAHGIEQALKNPKSAQNKGQQGRIAFQKDFNWELEKTKLLNLYDELLQ